MNSNTVNLNSHVYKLFLTCLALFSFTGCTRAKSDAQSILVIMVDQLSSQDLDCSREFKTEVKKEGRSVVTQLGGLEVLCQSAYRFAHAYTNSTLSVPAVATLLTGQVPLAHGVHHNGATLSPQIETTAERAYLKNYDTSFFSGGAPVIRKTGLHQGFSLFDDSVKLSTQALFRTSKATITQFKNRHKEIGKDSFLTFFYFPDLRFTNQQTLNSMGEPRNLSYESQLDELDSSLGELFSYLKNEGRWESTQILLVGLNGRKNLTRSTKLSLPTNLHSENTQIAVLWKPVGKLLKQSTVLNTPISLADIGATVYHWIDQQPVSPEIQEFSNLLLDDIANFESNSKSENFTNNDRWILIESGWSNWRFGKPLQFGLRKGNLFCLETSLEMDPLKCFNSLTDKDERFELAKNDTQTKDFLNLHLNLKKRFGLERTDLIVPPPLELKKLDFNHSPCFKLFLEQKFEYLNTSYCDDPVVADLYQWIADEKNPLKDTTQKEMAKKRFIRSFTYEHIDRKIVSAQVENSWIWDVPRGLMVNQSPLELIFEIPELNKIKTQALRALNQSHDE